MYHSHTNQFHMNNYCISLLYSLLDILSGKKGDTGDVLVDGQRQQPNFKYESGYVVQVRMHTSNNIRRYNYTNNDNK